MSGRLIIASNRLPVSVNETEDGLVLSRSNGGLATALASLFSQEDSLWIGWTGMRRHMTDAEIQNLQFPPYVRPINLTNDEISYYYDDFSNGILWPLAHGLAPTVPYKPEHWRAMRTVADKFADSITTVIQPNDVIWIHDYHLLPLTGVLRRRGVRNRIGFFLHTPVMSLSQTAHLPHATAIFKSLARANLIGVQTPKDAKRLRHIFAQYDIKDHGVIKAFPIGIDATYFHTLARSPGVQKLAKKHRKQHNGKTCIFSLSRLDYTKGLITQLRAYEHLLKHHPELGQRVIYRLNVAPSREAQLEYRDLKQATENLAAAINQTYRTTDWLPIVYSYINMNPTEFTAWYEVSDIHLNTPVADGMNLIAKEYIAGRTQPGSLVISGTMGAAHELSDALIVPPKDIAKISDALYRTITMPDSEKIARWQLLTRAVTSHQAIDWANEFLHALQN